MAMRALQHQREHRDDTAAHRQQLSRLNAKEIGAGALHSESRAGTLFAWRLFGGLVLQCFSSILAHASVPCAAAHSTVENG